MHVETVRNINDSYKRKDLDFFDRARANTIAILWIFPGRVRFTS